MKGQPVVIAEKGQPVVIMGYIENGEYIEGLPDIGGGGGSAPIVKTEADLSSIVDPVDKQLVAVLETNTFWQYNATTLAWENTNISYLSYYGGQVAETNVELVFQDYKSDSELIELFGVVSDSTITVDQSSVVYDTVGKHNVIFKFSKGRSITCSITIINRYTYDLETLKYNCKLLPNSSNFIDNYPLALDFSNYTLRLNGATSPVINGNTHIWSKRPLTDINKVGIEFANMATLKDGSKLHGLITFGEFEQHAKLPANQKWGFDIIDGNFVYLDGGFVFQKVTLELFKENGDIVYLNIASRIDNIHYAKHVGADVGSSEFFVSSNTLLLGETYSPHEAELPIFVASRYPGDGDTPGDDRIAMGIVKQDTTTITFIFGKDYTGSMDEDGSTLNMLDFPVAVRVGELTQVTPVDTVYRENLTPTIVTPGSTQILMTVNPGILKSGKKYELRASAKYTRTLGSNNVSNVRFRIIQGITNIVNDTVSVTRDTTTGAISMNIPQVVRRLEFNDTETVVIEATVDTGQVEVTINEAHVRLTEVREVEL